MYDELLQFNFHIGIATDIPWQGTSESNIESSKTGMHTHYSVERLLYMLYILRDRISGIASKAT